MNLRDIFAANMRRYRTEAGISQEELAHLADINRTYVSKLETGISWPGLEIIEKVAKVLEIEPALMLERKKRK